MDLRPEEIEYKKRVGTLAGAPVIEVGLKGGLHLLFTSRGGKFETLGAGPHRAVARHIAKKKTENKIEFTDLSKSDWIEPAFFEHLLPHYEAMTDAFRERQGL